MMQIRDELAVLPLPSSGPNKSSDFLQVELVGVYSVKLVRAQIEGNTDAAEKLDRMIRCHMKDLKTSW